MKPMPTPDRFQELLAQVEFPELNAICGEARIGIFSLGWTDRDFYEAIKAVAEAVDVESLPLVPMSDLVQLCHAYRREWKGLDAQIAAVETALFYAAVAVNLAISAVIASHSSKDAASTRRVVDLVAKAATAITMASSIGPITSVIDDLGEEIETARTGPGRAGARKAHEETEKWKAEFYEWYASSSSKYKSKRQAAIAASKVWKIDYRTALAWIDKFLQSKKPDVIAAVLHEIRKGSTLDEAKTLAAAALGLDPSSVDIFFRGDGEPSSKIPMAWKIENRRLRIAPE